MIGQEPMVQCKIFLNQSVTNCLLKEFKCKTDSLESCKQKMFVLSYEKDFPELFNIINVHHLILGTMDDR